MTTLSMMKKPAEAPGKPPAPKLEKASKKKRIEQTKKTDEIIRYLEKKYPKCFNEADPVPLAIGVFQTIVKDTHACSNMAIRHALRTYCKRYKYLKALVAGGARINLKGIASGGVSSEHKRIANQQLQSKKVNNYEQNRL